MPANASTVLSSWKEIATYLGKGVRTVQRWERELRLPVHRPVPSNKRVVIALPKELDAWVQRQMPPVARGNAERARLRAEVRAQRSRLVELRSQLRALTQALQRQCRSYGLISGAADRVFPKPR